MRDETVEIKKIIDAAEAIYYKKFKNPKHAPLQNAFRMAYYLICLKEVLTDRAERAERALSLSCQGNEERINYFLREAEKE